MHGDAHHTHRAHGHLPEHANVAWTFRADGPIEAQTVVSPDLATLYVSTLGGTLWALDRLGKPRFHVGLGGRGYGTPYVAKNGMVYVGRDGGALLALDVNGRVAWRLETDGDADTGVTELPSGVLVFGAGSHVYGAGPDDRVSFRFDARGKVFSTPAFVEEPEPSIVFGSQDHHVYALGTDGTLRWSTDVGHDVDTSPAISDDGQAIFVGTDGDEVLRLARDGHIVWRTPTEGMVRGALSVTRNGDLLAGVYGPSPRVLRLTDSGVLVFGFAVRGYGTRETGVWGAPLEDDDGALAFGGQDGRVHVLEPDGRERWSYDAHADVDAPLTLLGDGVLIAASYDGNLIAIAR